MAARWFECIQQVILRLSPGKRKDMHGLVCLCEYHPSWNKRQT